MGQLFQTINEQYQRFLDSLQYELNYDNLEVDGIFPKDNSSLILTLVFTLEKQELFRLYVDNKEGPCPMYVLYEDEDLPICEEYCLEDMFENVICYVMEKLNNNFGFTTSDS